MNITDKLTALSILSRIIFKSKNERQAQDMVIDSIKKDLTPRDQLPLIVTEVYIDKPHIKTEYNEWSHVMGRIEKVRENEGIYAIHVTRGGEKEYTWEAKK